MPRIEDYALIGDMRTAALVCADGSIDWLCLPRFDASAVFARLLGTAEHGFWRLGPASPDSQQAPRATWRRYRGDSLVLETVWETAQGTVRVVDFMPPDSRAPRVIRIVEGVTGTVDMRSVLKPRFDYGKVVPRIHRTGDRLVAEAGPDAVYYDAQVPTRTCDGAVHADFPIRAGERIAFAVTWHPSHAPAVPRQPNATRALQATQRFWRGWAAQCTYSGPYRDAVVRSLITLKALTYAPTGGIVAAPTTSLPEDIGGVRNWDYRYTWLRDAAITLSSLLRTGYRDEARAWREWLLRAVAGDPHRVQIMYGIAGERDLTERELPWLPGYEDSLPVRTGNGASDQLQLDVFGEIAETLFLGHNAGLDRHEEASALHLRLVDYLAERWREPDEGIWEIRGERRHFVHSKVMAWVAVDRTVELIESGAIEGPADQLRTLRDDIHREVCEKGYDPVRNTFTQSYGSTELDASLLLIARTGFLPPEDKRLIGTVEAVQRELSTDDGLIMRYPVSDGASRENVDGLPGGEGAFLACSFWLADALAMIGRNDEARRLFERLLALRNDLGLLAEEWDPLRRRQVGNYPQAFSHIGLINTAVQLAAARPLR